MVMAMLMDTFICTRVRTGLKSFLPSLGEDPGSRVSERMQTSLLSSWQVVNPGLSRWQLAQGGGVILLCPRSQTFNSLGGERVVVLSPGMYLLQLASFGRIAGDRMWLVRWNLAIRTGVSTPPPGLKSHPLAEIHPTAIRLGVECSPSR